MKNLRVVAAVVALASGVAFAQTGDKATSTQQQRPPQHQKEKQAQAQKPLNESMLDVEELRDELPRYVNQTVQVAGEIDRWVDGRAFVMESGGLFNDQIVVLVPNKAKGIAPAQLGLDDDVVVTGKVRQVGIVDFERELGWDLDPHIEAELSTANFLVADRIGYQQD